MQVSNNSRVKIATRAAIDHEGQHVLGGRSICEGGIKEDNYIAELAAQLDALTDAVTRGSEERIVIVFDATSAVGVWDRSNEYCTDLVHAWARGTRMSNVCRLY